MAFYRPGNRRRFAQGDLNVAGVKTSSSLSGKTEGKEEPGTRVYWEGADESPVLK